MIRDPSGQLKQICMFLGVEYEEKMLSHYQSEAAKALSHIRHHSNMVKPIFTRSAGKYHKMLAREEICRIHERLGSPMRCLGYLSQHEYEEARGASC
jgi:hypothetical protein